MKPITLEDIVKTSMLIEAERNLPARLLLRLKECRQDEYLEFYKWNIKFHNSPYAKWVAMWFTSMTKD